MEEFAPCVWYWCNIEPRPQNVLWCHLWLPLWTRQFSPSCSVGGASSDTTAVRARLHCIAIRSFLHGAQLLITAAGVLVHKNTLPQSWVGSKSAKRGCMLMTKELISYTCKDGTTEVSWVSLKTHKVKMNLCTQSKKQHNKHNSTCKATQPSWLMDSPSWPHRAFALLKAQTQRYKVWHLRSSVSALVVEMWPHRNYLVSVRIKSCPSVSIPVLPTEMLMATCSTLCHSTHSFAFLHQNKKSHWFLLFMLPLPAPANNCHCCSLSIFDE